jgi:hypothetical protein
VFRQIHKHNDKAMVTEVTLKNLISNQVPHKILEQMGTVDLTGKTDTEIFNTITKADRTAE